MSEHRKASVKANDASAGTAGVDWSVEEIRTLVGRGYISEHKHPALGLWIFNYTSKTQYEALWTPETLSCRGLILDGSGAVVTRPLRKLFGLGEPAAPPVPDDEPFEVFEKLDGSLIVATSWRGRLIIATRGSFISPQAHLAEELFHERYPRAVSAVEEGKTYLFELIHPSNRIVVEYGAEEALYLLAVVENASGKDLMSLGEDLLPGVPVARSYPDYIDLSALPERENAEGYVVRFASGVRFKVKHPEYVRVHRLISHATPKHVWEYLERGEDPLSNLEGVPDEVYGALEGYADDLRARYSAIETAAGKLYEAMNGELGEDASRKEKALWIRRQERSLQPVLSGKDYSRTNWREIKPQGEGV